MQHWIKMLLHLAFCEENGECIQHWIKTLLHLAFCEENEGVVF